MAGGGARNQVCVGAIAGAFGVRGELRLKPFTGDPADIAAYGPVSLEDGSRVFVITLTRAVKGGYAARLSGVTTREQAEALRGARLYVDRDRLPAPDADEFYHADLLGMTVEDLSGVVLGRVKSVQNYGAGDLLEILPPGGGSPLLLAFTLAAVPHVDVAGRKIIADPPAETDAEDQKGV